MPRWCIALAIGPMIAACGVFGASSNDAPSPPAPSADASAAPDAEAEGGATPPDGSITPTIDGGTGLRPEVCGLENCPQVSAAKDNCKKESCEDLDDFKSTNAGVTSQSGVCRMVGSGAYVHRERERVSDPKGIYELVFDLVALAPGTNARIVRISIDANNSHVVSVLAKEDNLYLCEETEGVLPRCTPGMPVPEGERVHVYGTVNGTVEALPRFGLAIGQCDERLALELERPLPVGSEVIGAIGCIATSETCSIAVDELIVLMRK